MDKENINSNESQQKEDSSEIQKIKNQKKSKKIHLMIHVKL